VGAKKSVPASASSLTGRAALEALLGKGKAAEPAPWVLAREQKRLLEPDSGSGDEPPSVAEVASTDVASTDVAAEASGVEPKPEGDGGGAEAAMPVESAPAEAAEKKPAEGSEP
jgi:hypothetical protein